MCLGEEELDSEKKNNNEKHKPQVAHNGADRMDESRFFDRVAALPHSISRTGLFVRFRCAESRSLKRTKEK
jgi:hypothetical protein